MTQILRLFFTVLLCLGLATSQAQDPVGFTLPFINNAAQNQVLDMPVGVLNFDAIVSMQYVIRWDPAVLEFQEVNGFNLPQLTVEKFALNEADSGIIRVVWWFVDGVTLPDYTPVFNLRMKVTGANLTSTSVYFTEITPTTFFEVINHSSQAFEFDDAILDDGFVAVGFTVDAGEPGGLPPFRVYAAPNPVGAHGMIWIDADRALDAGCTLTDPAGRLVFSKKLSLTPGKNGMEIASYLAGQQGTWYLSVRTPFGARVVPLLSL